MDFEEIKNLIEIDGGKFIIVENGKPTMVIAGFDEYKKKLMQKQINLASYQKEQKTLPVGRRAMPKELEAEPLKLEDLPL